MARIPARDWGCLTSRQRAEVIELAYRELEKTKTHRKVKPLSSGVGRNGTLLWLNTWPFVERRRIPSAHFVGDRRDPLYMAKLLHGITSAITIPGAMLLYHHNPEIMVLFVMLAAATGLTMRFIRYRNMHHVG